MKNNIYILIICIVFGFFLYGRVALAATSPTVFTLRLPDSEVVLTQDIVTSWHGSFTLVDKPEFMGGGTRTQISYDPVKVYAWVQALTDSTDKDAQEGSLTIENNHAADFTPPVIGRRLDAAATTWNIIKALSTHEAGLDAVVYSTKPKTSLAGTNNLGINELIGHGESIFKGSPKNRRYNINVGVNKLKGVIVAPGEEFSFDKNICPVDKSTGYLPELVIKAEGTVPEYGGGLCQVSSTVFRAAMNTGLKITMRKNHSYAVQYYAPQGTDATTYCGGIDFRFLNDTPGSILIWPHFEETDKLVFDFYGTKDSRQVVLDKPVQFDRKSDGSMKASWTRHITKDGVTITDEFKSNYLPPALFHKEEKLDSPGQSTPSTTLTTTPNPPPPTIPPPPVIAP